MVDYDPALSCVAVSYNTTTFTDLEYNLAEAGIKLHRVDPGDFLSLPPDYSNQYINLVIRDLTEREQVSNYLDQHNLSRFSFIHDTSTVWVKNLGKGLFVYPYTLITTNIIVGNDVIFQGHTGIAHQVQIGTGSIIGGFNMISGSTVIGKFCLLYIRVSVYDKINICDRVVIGADSIIRKDITESGTYSTIFNQKTIKIVEDQST
jgi:acetyltransferase-like isoleucine patch superfamily enzyme